MTGEWVDGPSRPCSLCGELQSERRFTWRAGRRDVRGSYCRTCRTAHRQARKRESSR